jgi:hypothetical protein
LSLKGGVPRKPQQKGEFFNDEIVGEIKKWNNSRFPKFHTSDWCVPLCLLFMCHNFIVEVMWFYGQY